MINIIVPIIALIIISIVLLRYVYIQNKNNETVELIVIFIYITAFSFISFIIGIIIYDNTIKAIDVYRGNTELIIQGEYKDSIFIPTDTIIKLKELNKQIPKNIHLKLEIDKK